MDTENFDEKKIDEGCCFSIIDGNFDFNGAGGALSSDGVDGEANNDMIITRINKIAKLPFGYIATSEDKHPKNHIEFDVFGSHCLSNTDGQKYHPELRGVYDMADEHLFKGEDPNIISISISTSLRFNAHIANLRAKKINNIYIAGWVYTHCVGEAAVAYSRQLFNVYVIRNATRSVPREYGGNPELMDKILDCYNVKKVYF